MILLLRVNSLQQLTLSPASYGKASVHPAHSFHIDNMVSAQCGLKSFSTTSQPRAGVL